MSDLSVGAGREGGRESTKETKKTKRGKNGEEEEVEEDFAVIERKERKGTLSFRPGSRSFVRSFVRPHTKSTERKRSGRDAAVVHTAPND